MTGGDTEISDEVLEDFTDEEIQVLRKHWKKCSKCKRYVWGHRGQYGKDCKMGSLSPEALEAKNSKVEAARMQQMKGTKTTNESEQVGAVAEGADANHQTTTGVEARTKAKRNKSIHDRKHGCTDGSQKNKKGKYSC